MSNCDPDITLFPDDVFLGPMSALLIASSLLQVSFGIPFPTPCGPIYAFSADEQEVLRVYLDKILEAFSDEGSTSHRRHPSP